MAEIQTQQEVHLDDDKHPQQDFQSATLHIDDVHPQNGHEPGVDFAGQGNNFDRNRPGSVYGRQSIKSTTSRTSMRPGIIKTDQMADQFFSYKENNVTKGIEKCKSAHLKAEVDGKFIAGWVLTEIDHWDNEREKVVLLSENSLVVCKYNFILNKVEENKRLLLQIIDTVAIGDFTYPPKSIMPLRNHGGVQVRWNKGVAPSFAQKWNPFSTSIPFWTFSHHPVIYNPKEQETTLYNVDDFYESLIQAISNVYKKIKPGEKVTILEGPILIESYASVSSMIFNQSGLGFFRDRNGISF